MQVDSGCHAAAVRTNIWLPYSEQKEKNQVFTKKKKNTKKNQKRVFGENYNRNVNYTFFFFCISIKNDGVKSIKGIRVGN